MKALLINGEFTSSGCTECGLEIVANKLHELGVETVIYNLLDSLRVCAILLQAYIPNTSEKIFDGIKKLSSKDINLVIVTDYLFSDSILYDDYTEAFRREIGKININLAKREITQKKIL